MANVTRVSTIAASLDASGYQRGAKLVEDANAKIVASGNRVVATSVKQDESTKRVETAFQKLVRGIDQAEAANARFERGMGIVNRALDRNKISAEQAVSAIEGLRDAHIKASVAASQHSTAVDELRARVLPAEAGLQRYRKELALLDAAHKNGVITAAEHGAQTAVLQKNFAASTVGAQNLGKAVGITKNQMQQLAPQINDVVTSLLGGASAFQVMTQQGGQVTQIFGGVGATVRAAGSALLGLVAAHPVVTALAVTLGLAALAAYNFETNARRIGDLQNSLRAYTAEWRNAATAIDAAARAQSRVNGGSTDDLRKAGTTLVQSGTSTADLQAQLQLAEQMAKAFGITLPEAAKKLAEAMRDPTEAAKKYVEEGLRTINAETLITIERLERQGKRAEAAALLQRQLNEATKGAAEPTTAFGQAMDRLGNAFSSVWELAKPLFEGFGGWVMNGLTFAVNKVAALVEGIGNLAAGLRALVNTPSTPLTIDLGGGQSANFIPRPGAWGRESRVQNGATEEQIVDQVNKAIDRHSNLTAQLNRYTGSGQPPESLTRALQITREEISILTEQFELVRRVRRGESAPTLPQQDYPRQTEADRAAAAEEARRRGGRTDADVTRQALAARNAAGDYGKGQQLADERAGLLSLQNDPRLEGNTQALEGIAARLRAIDKEQKELAKSLGGTRDEVQNYVGSLVAANAGMDVAEGATRDLAVALAKLQEAELKAGRSATTAERAAVTSTVLGRLAGQYRDAIAQTNRAADANIAIAAAYRVSGEAGRRAEAEQKAMSDARTKFIAGSPEYIQAVKDGTEANLRLAQTAADAAVAQSNGQRADDIKLLEKEAELAGLSANERERQLAAYKAYQDALRSGASAEAASSAADMASKLVDAQKKTEQINNSWEILKNAGTNAFTKVGDAITTAFANGTLKALKFKDIMKGMLSSLVQDFAKLAILNPISNALFGGTAGTLGGLMGGGGSSTIASSLGMVGGMFSGGVSASTPGTVTTGGSSSMSQYGDILSMAKKGYDLLGGSGGGGSIGNWVSGIANTPLYTVGDLSGATNAALGQMGGAYGPAAPSAVAQNGGMVGTIGSTVSGVAGIAGGAYGVYSGLERGGVGGYTTAAGGAVGIAAGASVLGAFGPALAALGPYGLVAAGVIMLIGSLLPGAKPSNMTGTSAIDLASGATDIYGQTGKKFSQENRDAADSLSQSVYQATKAVQQLIPAAQFFGRLTVDVGNRDGVAARYLGANGYDTGTAHFSNDEEGQKQLMTFALTEALMQMAPRLDNVLENAIGGMAKGSVEEIMTNLAKLSDATNGGRPTANQNIAGARLDWAGNFDAAIADLKWVKDSYEPAIAGTARAASAFLVQIDGVKTQWTDLIDHANRLGLATDMLSEKFSSSIKRMIDDRNALAETAMTGLVNRANSARGIMTQDIELQAFDANATDQRRTWEQQLYDWGFTVEEQTRYIVQLEDTLGAERAAIIKKWADAAVTQYNSYYDTIWDAQDRGYFSTARDIMDERTTLSSNADFVGRGYDPMAIYTARADKLFKSLDTAQLTDLVAGLRGWDDTMAKLGQAALDLRLTNDKQTQAADDLKAAADALQSAAQSISPTVGSLTGYTRSLRIGDTSPLGARDQYDVTKSTFETMATAAAGGSASALRNFQTYAADFLGASRNVNGSGSAYVEDFNRVIAALEATANVDANALTADVLREETRSQTATLVDELALLRAEVTALRRENTQAAATPDRLL